MKFVDGWLTCSRPYPKPFRYRKLPSPHFNARPSDVRVNLLVIHNISLPPGQFGSNCVEDFFCGTLDYSAHPWFENIRGVEVSAHFLIKRGGEVVQFVSCDQRAWHAGKSVFEGIENCNDYSIGIELEGTDDTPYSAVQYQSLKHLIQCIQTNYPQITQERIVGHQHIAPQRKTDPGASFDWQYLFSELKQS